MIDAKPVPHLLPRGLRMTRPLAEMRRSARKERHRSHDSTARTACRQQMTQPVLDEDPVVRPTRVWK